MHSTHYNRRFISLMVTCLLCLLAACSANPAPTTKGNTSTAGIKLPAQRSIMPVIVSATIAMPPTQTTCPPAGTARAIITAPLALGLHQGIIYTLNQGSYDTPTQGKLMRYDSQTGRKTELLTVSHAHIYEAQISADGQWVIFVTTTGISNRQTQLQLIRMDGKGLQTLSCAPGYSIQQMQWSPDQHNLVYYNVVNEQGVVYLLDLVAGKIQIVLTTPPQVGILLRTWFDTTHIYLSDSATDTVYTHVYLLDIKKGPQQHLSDLLTVLFQEYGDFDSSDDGASLITTDGNCRDGTCTGPSHITIKAIAGGLGGPQRTIFRSQAYDAIAVRAIDNNTILFIIDNSPTDPDTSHNGLWIIHMDGTGLTRLITTNAGQYSYMNYRSQEPWSNISRDGSMYVVQVNEFQNVVEKHTLLVGLLLSGPAKVFASIADGSQLGVVGWTIM